MAGDIFIGCLVGAVLACLGVWVSIWGAPKLWALLKPIFHRHPAIIKNKEA